jgi:predicted deacylase
MRPGFLINGMEVQPGKRALFDLELPKLNSHTALAMPVHVIHGRHDGPRLFLCAALHGDEVNGVEIIRQVLNLKALNRLHGTLVAVPVVNVYGVIHQSRYLPDRRDLNRSFPGHEFGSMTARVCHLFMTEIVYRCTHGIDLHTGAIHRSNLPQIRANLDDPETECMARAFGVPVLLNSSLRDGSLRQAAAEHGIPTLLYEAGEALRYDDLAIRAGVHGVIQVMRELGMLPHLKRRKSLVEPFIARSSTWIRAPESGMLRTKIRLGALVQKNDVLGYVSDPYSGESFPVITPIRGVVIGRIQTPMTHEGEALFHIARFKDDIDEVVGQVETFHQAYADDYDD